MLIHNVSGRVDGVMRGNRMQNSRKRSVFAKFEPETGGFSWSQPLMTSRWSVLALLCRDGRRSACKHIVPCQGFVLECGLTSLAPLSLPVTSLTPTFHLDGSPVPRDPETSHQKANQHLYGVMRR